MRQLILFALLFLPRFVCGQEDLYQRLKRGLYQGLPQIHTPNKSLQVLKKVQDVNPSTTTENPFNPYKDGTHSVVLHHMKWLFSAQIQTRGPEHANHIPWYRSRWSLSCLF